MYSVADESEIFDIADEYLTAIENNSEAEYWKNSNKLLSKSGCAIAYLEYYVN